MNDCDHVDNVTSGPSEKASPLISERDSGDAVARYTKKDNSSKSKQIYTACILGVFFALGGIRGQFGPAFLDLQQICGADLERGSWIMTSFFLGYILGSFLAGLRPKRVNRMMELIGGMGTLTVVMAAIPWCTIYPIMLGAHVVEGALQGILDTAANAEIILTWKERSQIILLASGILFGVGSIISPLATAPFLSLAGALHSAGYWDRTLTTSSVSPSTFLDHMESNLTANMALYSYVLSHGNSSAKFMEESVLYATLPLINSTPSLFQGESFNQTAPYSTSDLYIPFSISAAVCGLLTLIFIAYESVYRRRANRRNSEPRLVMTGTVGVGRKIPRSLKWKAILVTGTFLFVSVSIGEAFVTYLNVFSVEQMLWSKSTAAMLTSVFNILGIVANVLAIFVGRWLSPLQFLGFVCLLILISMIGVCTSSLYKIQALFWVAVALSGFGNSLTFTLLFSWTNQYLFLVSNRITSLFLVTSMIGSSLNPILLSYVMEEVSYYWFVYLFLIESGVLMTTFTVGVVLTRHIVGRHGKTFDENIQEETLDTFVTEETRN